MDPHGNAEKPEMDIALGRGWFAEQHRESIAGFG
jgi:hypothetical protein